jgi:acyl carrier protein
LDLSKWALAFTGAEPIHAETLERFASAFADCGFRREAFYPVYGLAEATLMVTGGPRRSPPTTINVDGTALAKNEVHLVPADTANARQLVGSGSNLPGQQVVIVDPIHCTRCADGQVGEIWVKGPSVAQGYYNLPDVTENTFQGRLTDAGEGPFLRTGDLGFCANGQLFVTGRLKDLIIVRGRNYYPQDIELTAETAYPGFRLGHCAAFSIDVDYRERLAVVQEIEPRQRNLDTHAALLAIRGAIAAEHELETHAILLVKAGTIPKTTSGKTRRFAVRELYLEGRLDPLAQWNANTTETEDPASETVGSSERPINGHRLTRDQIESWLVAKIAARMHLPREEVDVTAPFQDFGMGSVDAIETVSELEKWLGRELPPTTVYHYPTIRDLAHYLSKPPSTSTASREPPQAASLPQNADSMNLLQEVRQLSNEEMEAFILQEMAKPDPES